MDPVSSRGSQSLSTTVESDVSPSGLVPKEGAAKTAPNASPVTANKLQSYLPTAGETQESMCRAPPPPFSRGEPQGEELKLLEQLHTRQAAASLGRGAELCKDNVDVDVIRHTGLKHHWLRTSTQEAGMGPDDGSVPGERPGKTPLYGPTRLNDHTGRGERPGAVCKPMENVDEACVDRELAQMGKPLGRWTFTHNCQTYAADVLEQCEKKEVSVPKAPQADPRKP